MLEDILLTEESSLKIERLLEEMLMNSKTKYVLLLSRGGQVIADFGFKKSLNVHSLSALLTGVYNATSALGKAIKEEHFNEFFLEGKKWNVYFRTVSNILLLASLFPDPTLLGLVKKQISDTALQIKTIFENEVIKKEREYLFKKRKNIDQIIDTFFS